MRRDVPTGQGQGAEAAPLPRLSNSTRLIVSELMFSFEDGPFVDLPIGHPPQRGIMPIPIRRDDEWEVAGTAFAIGQHAALSPRHTLVDDDGARSDEANLLYIGGKNKDDGVNRLGRVVPSAP
jgi:hypothetical protein